LKNSCERPQACAPARFGGAKHPTRRSLGAYGPVSLEKARNTARDWLAASEAGKDPGVESKRQAVNTIGAALARYEAEVLKGPDSDRPLHRAWRQTSVNLHRELAPWVHGGVAAA
jgi:hypothetical protein